MAALYRPYLYFWDLRVVPAPGNTSIQYRAANLSFIAIQMNQPENAIKNARKAIEIFPDYPDAYLNLARGYAAKKMVAQASDACKTAVRLNPSLKSAVDQEFQNLR